MLKNLIHSVHGCTEFVTYERYETAKIKCILGDSCSIELQIISYDQSELILGLFINEFVLIINTLESW